MALVEVSEDTFNDTVTQEGIVLVDAWAEWCGTRGPIIVRYLRDSPPSSWFFTGPQCESEYLHHTAMGFRTTLVDAFQHGCEGPTA